LEAASILNNRELKKRTQSIPFSDYTLAAQLDFAHFIKYKFKQATLQLLDIYYQLDAWYGMASATLTHKLAFPEFLETHTPLLEIEGLYHPLLEHPVDYDIELNNQQNFLFLTGANMAGKSTFIKSLGIATFMAHLGMGVPAKKMALSMFDGILSNINISDNLARGESYFYNEVKRIKITVQKISDQRHWLVLIDELFKGTNVEDAMKCSIAVVEGFTKIKSSVFLLSTHLYEIGSNLKKHRNILFKYFETDVTGEKLHFSYELKEGISQDRLGYLILKNEGVVEMLDKIPSDN
jgi:DNA mismatch repair ATPase MutS